jgi:molecular chaperone GrpE
MSENTNEHTPQNDTLADESPVTIESLQTALAAAESKATDHWDKLLRAVAELENVKRRAEKDVVDAHRYALNRFVDDLIPIVDSLEQALLNCKETEAMKGGIELTLKMFLTSLQKFGVKILDPTGETFDPNFHEAMMMQETTEAPHNTVLTVVQKGYSLHDRIIRPARVIVAKGA